MAGPPERDPPGRRRFLRAAGAASTLAVVGCLGSGSEEASYDLTQDAFDPAALSPEETYPDDDEVAMFRGGLRRLGYYPDETVPERVAVNWQMPVNYIGHNAAKASPVPTPDGETILIPADTGRIHGVTPGGKHRWLARTVPNPGQGIHASPVIVDGVAYLGDYGGAVHGQDAAVYAFDVENGEQLWRNDRLGGAVAIGSSAGYWDGYLYVVVEYRHPEQTGSLWVFDAETGETLREDDRIDLMPHPTVAIHPGHERLLTGSNDGVLYCWEFPSLEFAWSFETGGEIKGPIATYDGGAFVGSWDNHFYRIGLAAGEEEWSFGTDGIVMSAPAIDPVNDVVYFGSDDWHVYALDASSGEELWSTNVQGRVMGALTVTDDAVLAGTTAAELVALEKDTGEIRWWVESNGQVTSAPVPHGGRIYYAERADVSGYWDADEETTVEVPGHAFCLTAR